MNENEIKNYQRQESNTKKIFLGLFIFAVLIAICLVFATTKSTKKIVSGDTTAPTISLSHASGTIKAGSPIIITASDISGINHIGYTWDSGNSTTTVYASSTTIYVPSNSSGTHTLQVYAKDNSSNYNFQWYTYSYTVN